MKAMVLDPQTVLYSMPDATAPHTAYLDAGQELEVTSSNLYNNERWASVSLPDGRRGYLPPTTRLQRLQMMRLQLSVDAHVEPSEASPVLERLTWGSTVVVLGVPVDGDQRWIAVCGPSGKKGFIPRDTPMEDAAQAARGAARAKRNMIVGGAWCGGGIAVTAITYMNASGGGTYVVTWGAIIFGGYQFLKGLLAYMNPDD